MSYSFIQSVIQEFL